MPLPAPKTDEVLALEASQGSRVAFEELVDRYGGPVVDLISRRIGDHHTALDLAQEAWVRLFNALARFDDSRSFRSWLFSIVLNATRDEGRRRERNRVHYLDDYRSSSQTEPEVDDDSEQVAERALIEESLAQVEEPFRTAVLLVDIEGLTYEEAAQALECALGTAKSRVNRGRLAFRDAWLRLSGVSAKDATLGGIS